MTVANVNVTKVLMKRGNTAQNAAYTGVNGEVVVDLQAKTLRIHDGSTLGGFVITAGGVVGGYSNTNAAAYLDSQNITSANIGGSQTFANANAAVQATAINSINANISAYQIFANANAAAQATSINNINANLGAFQTYANTTFGTSSYANANVKSYLAAFDGNILPSANVTYSLGNEQFQWRDLWVSNNTIYIGNTPIRVDGGTLLVNNSPIASGSTANLVNGIHTVSLGADGRLTAPGDVYGQYFTLRGGNGPGAEIGSLGYGGNVVTVFGFEGFNVSTGAPEVGPQWQFDVGGNLITPTGLSIGDIQAPIPGTDINQAADEYLTITSKGSFGITTVGWAETPYSYSNVATIDFNSTTDGAVKITTGNNFAGGYSWRFDSTGNLTLPANVASILYANGVSILDGISGAVVGNIVVGTGEINFVASSSGDGNGYSTIQLIPDNSLIGSDQYLILDPTAPGHIHIRAGGTQDSSSATLFLGGENSHFMVSSGMDPQLYIRSNNNDWVFGTDGNLNLPVNGTINYANGTGILNSLASVSYVDTKISDLVDNAPELLNTLGEIAANLAVEANAVGAILNSITNTNANVTAANVNISALQSNAASQQTSIDTLLSRVDQAVNMTSSPQFAGLFTTANVQMNSNVRISKDLIVDGNINFIGNVTQTNITTANAVFTGDTYGFGALYAGVLGYTPLPYTVIQATADYDDYSQINFQNLNLSANASTEWVATAGNGTDLTNYIDFGIAGGAWNGTQLNSVGTAAKANDGWIYVLGNTAAGTGGNLILGTIQPGKRVNILTGGPGSANIYSYFNSTGLTTANVYAANYLYANGVSILTGIGGTYSNTNVAAYLAGNVSVGNLQLGNAFRLNGLDNSLTTINGSAIQFWQRVNFNSASGIYSSGTINAQSGTASGSTGTGAVVVTGGMGVSGNIHIGSSNSNSVVAAGSIVAANYNFANGVNILSTVTAGSTYSNVNVEAYIGGNIGAYQTFANANAAAQATSIISINANLGAFQTYANNTFGGSSYGNAAVAAYLPTHTGNIGAGNVTVVSTVTAANIVTTGTYGNITGANVISANTFVFGANGVNILTAVAGGATDNELRANVGAYQIFANANAAAQTTSIDTINANIGSYQTFANANAATQATSINTINANLGSFQTYANVTFGTSSYGDANVAAYLPTYTGVVAASRAQVTNSVDFMYGGFPYMGWQLTDSETLRLRTNISSGDYTNDAILVNRQSLEVNVVAQLTVGNVVTTNGVYWANGAAYSSGTDYGNTQVAAYLVANPQPGTYSNVNVEAYIGGNIGAFQTYANATFGGSSYGNTNVAAYLTGNITVGNINATQYNFANGVNILSTVVAGSYGNTEVAAYLMTWPNADINILDATSANITTLRAANFNSANAVISGGYISALTNASIISSTVVTGNITNGNVTTLRATNFGTANAVISGGYISTLTNAYITLSRVTNFSTGNAVLTGGYINSFTNVYATTGSFTNLDTSNILVTGGYISSLANATVSGNVTAANLIGYGSNTSIVAGAYTTTFLTNGMATVGGNVTTTGNVTASGIAPFYAPNRPAFRVYGFGTTNNLTTTQNTNGVLNNNNWAVDYEQGNYLNGTTGVFTAPAAGLYQISVIGRNSGYTSGISQLVCVKNYTGSSQVLTMLEFGSNSSMNHAGTSTVARLVAGDTLAIRVTAGEINFDVNDSWSVTYIG